MKNVFQQFHDEGRNPTEPEWQRAVKAGIAQLRTYKTRAKKSNDIHDWAKVRDCATYLLYEFRLYGYPDRWHEVQVAQDDAWYQMERISKGLT